MTKDKALRRLRTYAAACEKTATTARRYDVRLKAQGRAEAYKLAMCYLRKVT